jgi:hypothetical protein
MRVLSPSAAAFVAGLFLATVSLQTGPVAAATPGTPTSEVSVPRQVLAFYYGWWATPSVSGFWSHWVGVNTATHTIASTRWYPADGPYDSHSTTELEEQNTEAQTAGITGWVYSWWGPNSFTDNTVPLLMQAAARHNLRVTIAIAQLSGTGATQLQKSAQTDVDYVLRTYGSKSNYLKVNGRPVIFLNIVAWQQLPATTWRTVLAQAAQDTGLTPFVVADTNLKLNALSTADAVYSYDLEHQQTENKTLSQIGTWAAAYYPAAVQSMGDRVSMATILPGHDASELDTRPYAASRITQRYNGGTFAALWPAAIAANPDWILIVSWNEWHEGSQIEPSYQFGTQATDTNAVYAPQFLALPPKTHSMN